MPTAVRSWRYTRLGVNMKTHQGRPTDEVNPFVPVTCKRCVMVLMGRAWEKWNWDTLNEQEGV